MNLIIRHNVFSPVLTEALRALLCREELFNTATVTGDASWRSGRVAHIEHLIEGRLAAEAILDAVMRLPDDENVGLSVMTSFCIPGYFDLFEPSRCEVQLSSYGDGDYFRQHNDSGTSDAADRKISWVSYLDPIPGSHLWTGGELHVRDGGNKIIYTPADGETVFFPSNALHEVQPVSTSSPRWEYRRFSINGWIR